MTGWESLLDYRRRVAALYAEVRARGKGESAHAAFVQARDVLFSTHPQSPLAAGEAARPSFFPYDSQWRMLCTPEPAEPKSYDLRLADDGPFRMTRIGRVRLVLDGRELALSLFWIEGYGGGLFLPFGDAGNGAEAETYGGGRYLLDTLKGADLGPEDGKLVLDFNYAYNPSCAYNPRWHCPLAPAENRLPVAVMAGERRFQSLAA